MVADFPPLLSSLSFSLSMPSMANTLNGNGVSLQVPAGNNLNDAKQQTRPKEKLTRTLSASTLRDRLSKLAATPLNVPNPVATLHANVKYVSLSLSFGKSGVSGTRLLISVQFRTG